MTLNSLTVLEDISAPIDPHGTVRKADRNIDIPFPANRSKHLHGSNTGLGIGPPEGYRFRLCSASSAQDEHAVAEIADFFVVLVILEQSGGEHTPLALEWRHAFLVRPAHRLAGRRVPRPAARSTDVKQR